MLESENTLRTKLDETTLRVDVAAGFRWLDRWGMSDLAAGSLVARPCAESDWLLTHRHGHHFDEIKASELVKVNFDGVNVDGSNQPTNFAALKPATAVFKARPDVHAIIHAHAPSVMAVSGLKCGLLLASEPAFMFHKGIAYIDANFKFDDAYCDAVANVAANGGKAIIYRNHSFAVVGKDVREAMLRTYLLNQACEIQLRMMATGQEINEPTEKELESHYDSFYSIENYVYDGSLEWAGMLRKLDREDSSFRD